MMAEIIPIYEIIFKDLFAPNVLFCVKTKYKLNDFTKWVWKVMLVSIFWPNSQAADGSLLARVSGLECAHCNHSHRGATIFGEATKLLLLVLSTALLVETERGTCGAFVCVENS